MGFTSFVPKLTENPGVLVGHGSSKESAAGLCPNLVTRLYFDFVVCHALTGTRFVSKSHLLLWSSSVWLREECSGRLTTLGCIFGGSRRRHTCDCVRRPRPGTLIGAGLFYSPSYLWSPGHSRLNETISFWTAVPESIRYKIADSSLASLRLIPSRFRRMGEL